MNIERAIILATYAHEGQKDKGGNPYILHPLAVMNRVGTIQEKIVAVLHDVVEDTSITLEQLKHEGFSQEIVTAINHLTRKENETYMEFIRRVKQNDIARTVKVSDIHENMDLSRIKNPSKQDFNRNKRYEKALKELGE